MKNQRNEEKRHKETEKREKRETENRINRQSRNPTQPHMGRQVGKPVHHEICTENLSMSNERPTTDNRKHQKTSKNIKNTKTSKEIQYIHTHYGIRDTTPTPILCTCIESSRHLSIDSRRNRETSAMHTTHFRT